MRTVLLILAALVAFARAGLAEQAFESAARQAILIDAQTGAVFYEKDADAPIPPASMSKLMTMVMVFEALKREELKLDQQFQISEDAWRRGGSQSGGSTMYAELNSLVALGDLIQGVIVQSANDACIAIAEGLSGSEEKFAEAMTARAREIGLKTATFRNATGLPAEGHRMSVRELSLIAGHIITNFPAEFKYYSQREFEWNKIKQQNRNPLLVDYPGADGMKTGYTEEAGYGLVGTATRGGRRLIMVIAGLDSLKARRDEAKKLLDWGFRQFKTVNLFAANEVVTSVRVWGGLQNWVEVSSPEAVKVLIAPQEQKDADVKIAYRGPLIAPVKAGQEVGTVRVVAAGRVLVETPVYAVKGVEPAESIWSRAWDSIAVMAGG